MKAMDKSLKHRAHGVGDKSLQYIPERTPDKTNSRRKKNEN